MSFALYLLAQNPQCQERLHEEITQSIGDNMPTMDDVKNNAYLKYVVKETMRYEQNNINYFAGFCNHSGIFSFSCTLLVC